MPSVPDRSGDSSRSADPRTVNRVEKFDPTNLVHQGIARSHERGENEHISIVGGTIRTPVQPGMEAPVPKSKKQISWSDEHTKPYTPPSKPKLKKGGPKETISKPVITDAARKAKSDREATIAAKGGGLSAARQKIRAEKEARDAKMREIMERND